jgi:hypothetical protein
MEFLDRLATPTKVAVRQEVTAALPQVLVTRPAVAVAVITITVVGPPHLVQVVRRKVTQERFTLAVQQISLLQ